MIYDIVVQQVAGSMVQTDFGFFPIEEIGVGYRVHNPLLMGENGFVQENAYIGVRKVLQFKVGPFEDYQIPYNAKVMAGTRKDNHIDWRITKAENVKPGEYIATHNLGSMMETDVPAVKQLDLTEDELYLIGRYIADGHIDDAHHKDRSSACRAHNVCYTIGKDKAEKFEQHLSGYEYAKVDRETAFRYIVHGGYRLMQLCQACGEGALHKEIPPIYLYGLGSLRLGDILEGYLDGDGYKQTIHSKTSPEKTYYMYTAKTVSRKLAYSLGAAILKAFHTPYAMNLELVPSTHVIKGKVVHQHPVYHVRFYFDDEIYGNPKMLQMVDAKYLWAQVRSIETLEERKPIYELRFSSGQEDEQKG